MGIGEVVTTIPTIGFNVDNVEYKNLKFTVWDVGGQQSIRQLWKHYYSNTDGIIFVIDANDTKRVRGNEHCAKEELHRLMEEEELQNCQLLVFANKQDLPNGRDTRIGLDYTKLSHTRHDCAYCRGTI